MQRAREERPWLYRADALINGRYRIRRRRSYGGTAEVYEAEDTRLFAHVALKVVHPEHVATSDALAQMTELMKREARLGAQLRSRAGKPGVESIVFVTDVDVTDDKYRLPFFVMELLEGYTLHTYVRRHREAKDPIRILSVLRFAIELTKVLLLLHDDDLVHCDLKPDNLFLHRGGGGSVLKLLDLGLAVRVGSQEKVRGFRGTPRHAAPEQFLLRGVRFGTDVYALGLILYEMLTLRGPFDVAEAPLGEMDLHRAHLTGPVASMCALRPEIPEAVDALVLAMLRKELEPVDPKRPSLREISATLDEQLKKAFANEGAEAVARDLGDDIAVIFGAGAQPEHRPLLTKQKLHSQMDVGGGDFPLGAATAPPLGGAPSRSGQSTFLVPIPSRLTAAAPMEAQSEPVAPPRAEDPQAPAADVAKAKELNRTDPDPQPFGALQAAIDAANETAARSSPSVTASRPSAARRAESPPIANDGTIWVESPRARAHDDPDPPRIRPAYRPSALVRSAKGPASPVSPSLGGVVGKPRTGAASRHQTLAALVSGGAVTLVVLAAWQFWPSATGIGVAARSARPGIASGVPAAVETESIALPDAGPADAGREAAPSAREPDLRRP